MSKKIAYFQLTAAMVFVGSFVVAGKVIVSDIPLFLSIFGRFLIANIALLPFIVIRRHEFFSLKLSKKDWFILFIQSLSGVFLFNVFLFMGLKYTTAFEGGILTSTAPAFVALLAWFFLKEKITRPIIYGLGLVLLGLVSLHWHLFDSNSFLQATLYGNLLILIAVLCEAIFILCAKVSVQKTKPFMTIILVNFISLLLSIPFVVTEFLTTDMSQLQFNDFILIFYIGIFGSILGYYCWYSGSSKVRTSTAASFTAIMPLTAIILSILIFDDAMFLSHIIGFACITFGIQYIIKKSEN